MTASALLDAGASRQEKVDALRAHLARIAPARPPRVGLPSGLPALDQAVGGWASAGLSEVVGRAGSGRLSLVLPALRALTEQGRPVAIVDPVGWLHPPGLDLVLDRLLLVRPGARALWATEQLVRSGALPLVLLLDPPPLGRGGRRLLHAAEAGGCALIVLTEHLDTRLQPSLRLESVRLESARLESAGRAFRVTRGCPRQDLQVSLPASS